MTKHSARWLHDLVSQVRDHIGLDEMFSELSNFWTQIFQYQVSRPSLRIQLGILIKACVIGHSSKDYNNGYINITHPVRGHPQSKGRGFEKGRQFVAGGRGSLTQRNMTDIKYMCTNVITSILHVPDVQHQCSAKTMWVQPLVTNDPCNLRWLRITRYFSTQYCEPSRWTPQEICWRATK